MNKVAHNKMKTIKISLSYLSIQRLEPSRVARITLKFVFSWGIILTVVIKKKTEI